jgi:hypothetical protein
MMRMLNVPQWKEMISVFAAHRNHDLHRDPAQKIVQRSERNVRGTAKVKIRCRIDGRMKPCGADEEQNDF